MDRVLGGATMAWARTLDDKLYKDSEGNKVRTDDFENLPLELWNSTTVLAYMDWLNYNKYGMVPKKINMQQTRAFIKRDLQQYGTRILKTFLSACVKDYKGNLAYPTLSYAQAMLIYKDKLMDKIIKETVTTHTEHGDKLEEVEW